MKNKSILKKFGVGLMAATLLLGCGSKQNITETTSAESAVVTTAASETTTEEPTAEETTAAETATEETTVDKTTAEETTTGETTTEETTAEETTTEETTTVAETTTAEETTTVPRLLTGITATITDKTRYVGDTLDPWHDFTVVVKYSDGTTETNPYGWYAGPMTLTNEGENIVKVVYNEVSTKVTVNAVAKPVEPETTAPAVTPVTPSTDYAAIAAADGTVTPAQVQYEVQKTTIQANEALIASMSQIPCIYINTLGNAAPASKEVYLDCTVDVFNVTDGSAMSGVAAAVRVRGNSTAQVAKPPLKIKFYQKQNLVGLHDGEAFKTWVILKPNWFMTADHLAFKLGKTLLGSRYVSDSKFVHVYVNNVDWGVCLACEQNQIKKKRVNVKEAESEATSPTDMGYFFEMDNYAGGDDAPTFWINNSATPVVDVNGVTRVAKNKGYTLKNNICSAAQLNYIGTYMNNLWLVIYNATYCNTAYTLGADGSLQAAPDLTPQQAIEKVLDVDSAVNTYILEEIFHDYDRGAGSFFMAVDFSAGATYNKLTFLAPWDFGYDSWSDDGSGLHAGVFTTSGDASDTDNIWLITLWYNGWFRKLVAQRYAELTQAGLLKYTTAVVDADLTAITVDASLSGQSGHLSSAHKFIAYTNKRIDWLAAYFATIQ